MGELMTDAGCLVWCKHVLHLQKCLVLLVRGKLAAELGVAVQFQGEQGEMFWLVYWQ